MSSRIRLIGDCSRLGEIGNAAIEPAQQIGHRHVTASAPRSRAYVRDGMLHVAQADISDQRSLIYPRRWGQRKPKDGASRKRLNEMFTGEVEADELAPATGIFLDDDAFGRVRLAVIDRKASFEM